MSSLNSHFTFEYSQPKEYHFSHDSVYLARHVFEAIVSQKFKHASILDLCSGCGIVGMDLLFHLLSENLISTQIIDFLEVQNIYLLHFTKNKSTLMGLFHKLPNISFLELNYDQISATSKKYDLIVANPPYFRKEHGALSPSEFKNRCRFFLDSDFPSLVSAIGYSLTDHGRAFVLLKSLSEHGVNIEQEFQSLGRNLKLKKIALIRDTDLFEITKGH